MSASPFGTFLPPSQRDVKFVVYFKLPEGDERCTRVARAVTALIRAVVSAGDDRDLRSCCDIVVARHVSKFDSDMLAEAVRDFAVKYAEETGTPYREVRIDPPAGGST